MALYFQRFLDPGQYELGEGRTRRFTTEELSQLASHTKEILGAGFSIPVWLSHPALATKIGGPSRPESDGDTEATGETNSPVGRLTKISQAENGGLVCQIEVNDPKAIAAIEDGSLQHTSPEIRPDFVDDQGKHWGALIAHLALTAHPRHASQPPLTRIESGEESMPGEQAEAIPVTSTDNTESLSSDSNKRASAAQVDQSAENFYELQGTSSPDQETRPSAPPSQHVAPESSVKHVHPESLVNDVVSDSAVKDSEPSVASDSPAKDPVPSVIDPLSTEHSPEEQPIEKQPPEEQPETDVQQEPVSPSETITYSKVTLSASQESATAALPLQFSPAEAALGEEELGHAQATLSSSSSPEVTEIRSTSYRQTLLDRIRRSRRIPQGLRDRLATVVETVQLSRDGEEEPTLKLSDAVAFIEDALPEQASLDAASLDWAIHPGGDSFFTGDTSAVSDDEARRIASEQLQAAGFLPNQSRAT